MDYLPASTRYDAMPYRRCGASGIELPAVSLGLWHNFGHTDRFDTARALVCRAFDLGITHFDLANVYGPPPGAAEHVFGEILRLDLPRHRDELVISTKAGALMGPGPYGDGGSRKYLVQSLDRSLARMGLDHVDIFYHHRADPRTPLAETMAALDFIVRSGRALYVGLSNYPAQQFREATALLRSLGTPCLIHQPRYNLFDRGIEAELLPALAEQGIGCIAYSPLAQGLLTDRYLGGRIPPESRAGKRQFLTPEDVTPARVAAAERLDRLARARGQSLAQMALAWVLRDARLTSVLIGASRVEQVEQAVAALTGSDFGEDELDAIERAVAGA